MRTRSAKNLGVLFLALALCCLPRLDARAIESSDIVKPLEIGVDAVIFRPLGLVTLAVGAVLFVPAIALSTPNLRATYEEAMEIFLRIPYENVFERPLGDF